MQNQSPTQTEAEHHLLRTAEEGDRFKWRAKIRANPIALFWYRIGVAIAGVVVMLAAIVSGPLPGPGGIPLFLIGVAILASEFSWARKIAEFVLHPLLARWNAMSVPQRRWFVITFVAVCWLISYTMLIVFGVPENAPRWLADLLHTLPFVG
ncbi:MAG: hypothetical protein CR980_00470 [Propionibacteriales bacterium]|nr:MAG: hypothetical protein CR980_00470 [Propionibacteriales bacterium]